MNRGCAYSTTRGDVTHLAEIKLPSAREIAIEVVRTKLSRQGFPDQFYAKLQIGAARDYGPTAEQESAAQVHLDAIIGILNRQGIEIETESPAGG